MTLYSDNYHKWVNKIMSISSDQLAPPEKITAIMLPDVIKWHSMKGDEIKGGLQKIRVQTIATFAGISPRSVQRVLKQFNADKLIQYEIKPTFQQGYKTDAYIMLTSAFLNAQLATSAVKNSRYRQKNYVPSPCCVGAELKRAHKVQYSEWVCSHCGQVHMLPTSKKQARQKAIEMGYSWKAADYLGLDVTDNGGEGA